MEEVRTNDQTVGWHVLAGDLQPATWCSTQIDAAFRTLEEGVFLVQLNEFEC